MRQLLQRRRICSNLKSSRSSDAAGGPRYRLAGARAKASDNLLGPSQVLLRRRFRGPCQRMDDRQAAGHRWLGRGSCRCFAYVWRRSGHAAQQGERAEIETGHRKILLSWRLKVMFGGPGRPDCRPG